jgi:outer membrane lipopolysaccharide assembly protein LptE/RlpB
MNHLHKPDQAHHVPSRSQMNQPLNDKIQSITRNGRQREKKLFGIGFKNDYG